MCLKLEGEVRGSRTFTANSGKEIEVLSVLAMIGKSERLLEVVNFSDSVIKKGKCILEVVPRVTAKENRAFLNWATYSPAVS